jgi:hypothetical protein
LDEAAKALKDDCLGFTLARDFDLREIGLLYYVMASSQTLGAVTRAIDSHGPKQLSFCGDLSHRRAGPGLQDAG